MLQDLYGHDPSEESYYVRMISRVHPDLKSYLLELAAAGVQFNPLFTNESFTTDAPEYEVGAHIDLWTECGITISHTIWGNEPNASADAISSDVKSPQEFADWWNPLVTAFTKASKERGIVVPWRFLAGQLGAPSDWIRETWPLLDPKPDGIDVHYPDTEQILKSYATEFEVQLAVGEWAWTGPTATRRRVIKWQAMLDKHTLFNSWFRAGPGDDAPGYELWNDQGYPTDSFYKYQAAHAAYLGGYPNA